MAFSSTAFHYSSHYIDAIIDTKNIVSQFSKISNFILPNGNENNTIIRKQITSNFQSRINHIEPICMKAAIAFCVALHWVNQ